MHGAADVARGHPRDARAMDTTTPAPMRWLGALLLTLAALLALVSVLGPLVLGAIDWRISDTVLNQLYGLDAVAGDRGTARGVRRRPRTQGPRGRLGARVRPGGLRGLHGASARTT